MDSGREGMRVGEGESVETTGGGRETGGRDELSVRKGAMI